MALSIIRLWFVATILTVSGTSASAQKFSSDPLQNRIAHPKDSLPDTWPAFKVWLQQQSALSAEQLPGVRERLYAYISADARQRAASGRELIPVPGDSLLQDLFNWADRLGVPGSALVAQKLDGSRSDSAQTSPGFTISFDSLYTLVAVEEGWRIRLPYYFMIGATTRQTLANGVETSVAIISTLFAQDSTEIPGASQATIFIVSALTSPAELTAFWLGQLSIQPTETMPTPTRSALRAYRARDAAIRMTKELVVFAPAGRTILFMYVGRDGTYEANRPHFIDVLNTLMVR